MKHASGSSFHMYYAGRDGTLSECDFGFFASDNPVKLFHAEGNNRKNYFYWRCNHNSKSMQGYYDPIEDNEIEIVLQFYETAAGWNADWNLSHNNMDYDAGSEQVNSCYDATPVCYQVLLGMFPACGFQLDDDSKYTSIEELSWQELLEALR